MNSARNDDNPHRNNVSTVALWIATLGLVAATLGCQERPAVEVVATPHATRVERRAYTGAPPVIPHAPLGADCVVCHTREGRAVPSIGYAPANPHDDSALAGALSNCRQCHVFINSESSFVASDFNGWQKTNTAGSRLFPTAPPTIPHRHFMRENCAACHNGPAARPEIRCTHPERTNCHQCHVFQSTLAQALVP